MTDKAAPEPVPNARVAFGDVLKILGIDYNNLAAAIRSLSSEPTLRGAVNTAHLALTLLPEEIARLPAKEPGRSAPRLILAMQHMRACEFTWVAAVRSMLMLHRAEGAANTRSALELLGAVFFILRLSKDVDDEALLDVVADSQRVGKGLKRFVTETGDTDGLSWLRRCKETCTHYGAHGGIGRMIGLTRPVKLTSDGRKHRLDSKVSYADLDPEAMPSMVSWLTSVAARSVNLILDEALLPIGLKISEAMAHARRELMKAATESARRYPIRSPIPTKGSEAGATGDAAR